MSADFTFFGGIYRNVHLVFVGKTACNMTDYGSTSFDITTNASTGEMFINLSYTTESSNIQPKIRYSVIDLAENKIIFQTTTKELPPGSNTHSITRKIAHSHLWNGLNDPFLYIIQADLIVDNTVVDRIETKCGFRTIEINTTGYFLNGRKYLLRGVSRHQSRLDKGWAISDEDEKRRFGLNI